MAKIRVRTNANKVKIKIKDSAQAPAEKEPGQSHVVESMKPVSQKKKRQRPSPDVIEELIDAIKAISQLAD